MRSGARDVRFQAGRHVVTAVTMLIGVLGIVAVAITNSIATDMLVAQQEQLNGRQVSYANSVQISAAQLDNAYSGNRSFDAFMTGIRARIGAQPADVGAIVDSSLYAKTQQEQLAHVNGRSLDVKWIDGNIEALQRLPALHGDVPAPSAYPPSIAVNQSALEALGVPVGATIILSDPTTSHAVTFTVSAEVADGQSQPTAYGGFATARAFFAEVITSTPTQVRVRLSHADQHAAGELLREVARQHGIHLADQTRRVDTVASVGQDLSFLQIVFAACAALVLFIAALGTANVGIASVAERSRELVVRRAIGARRRDIFGQVMWASIAVGVVVAVIAIGLAIAGVYLLLPRLIPVASSIVTPEFPWQPCLYGAIAAITTSAIGGIIPAVKATRLPVARALRE